MKLKATDSFYTDETGSVSGGKEFEVESDETGKALIKRGLATEVETAKMENAPQNKAAPQPSNTAAAKPSVKVETASKAK